ncbi:MAG: competence/damage-inducible protein A [Acidimicrobiia bacterium]
MIAVGTELLLGQIVNSNGAAIGSALHDAGLDAHYQVVVGDNRHRVEQAIRTGMERADAVILTGGIGPTQDDLTREAICGATGRRMAFSQAYAEELTARWAATGREMPASNLRQAEYPEGAELLPNPKGTAPGIVLEHQGKLILAVPGVPEEMHLLLVDHVLPLLRRAGDGEVLVSRLLRTWGRSESQVAELLDDLYLGSTNPSLAFLASGGEIKLRITAKGTSEGEARALIAPMEKEVRTRLGPTVFGADADTIEEVLLRMLEARGWTLGTAESATGGMVAGRVTGVPGSSRVFRGAVVGYASDLKERLLGVERGVLEAGVVSEPAALAMASGARRALGVDVAVAVTGSAGPDLQERPAGTMVVAVATPDEARARTLRFPGDRERVRVYTTTAALHLTRLAVAGEWWGS